MRRAVENNPDLAIVRLGTEVEAARVGESRGAFMPVFSTATGPVEHRDAAGESSAGERGVDVDDWFSSTGVRQRLPVGLRDVERLVGHRRGRRTNNPISSFDPSLQSGISAGVFAAAPQGPHDRRRAAAVHDRQAQPGELGTALPRGGRPDRRRGQAGVLDAQGDAARTSTVQQRSLELAQELARENKVRVDAGQIPPLDLVQAEAEVAQRRESLIRANTVAEDAEDALRRLIVDPADARSGGCGIEPVEEPTALGVPLLTWMPPSRRRSNERYDLARAGHELENARTTVEFLNNQRLPDVRLETSYRGNGLGGTQFLRGGGFPGLVTGTRSRGFGDALGQVFTSDYPTWSLGLTVSYPLGRSFEAASYARADVERRQAAQRIASLRVEAAETVRRAGRQIHSTAERVEAARAGATLAQQRLDSEQRRFEVGLSTTFLVTQAQRDLLEAQVNLLQTTLDYESALVNFEAVQLAPPLAAGDTVGVRGANVVLLPTPDPRGLFRPGSGGGF